MIGARVRSDSTQEIRRRGKRSKCRLGVGKEHCMEPGI
jgi:hypothetical protein